MSGLVLKKFYPNFNYIVSTQYFEQHLLLHWRNAQLYFNFVLYSVGTDPYGQMQIIFEKKCTVICIQGDKAEEDELEAKRKKVQDALPRQIKQALGN